MAASRRSRRWVDQPAAANSCSTRATTIPRATRLAPPSGTITSAHRFEGSAKFQVHRLDRRHVLAQDVVDVPAALLHVAPDAADQAHVGVGVDVDLEVEELTDRRLGEEQDPFGQHHRARLDAAGLPLAPVVDEVVDRRRRLVGRASEPRDAVPAARCRSPTDGRSYGPPDAPGSPTRYDGSKRPGAGTRSARRRPHRGLRGRR